MARPKRDDRTKDTIEVVNRAGNRARVDPSSASEAYFKARGYKPVEDEEPKELDDGKAALLRPRGAAPHAPAEAEKKVVEPEKPRPFGEARTAHEAEKPETSKGKSGKE